MLLLSKKFFHSISSLLFYPFQNRRSILLPHYDKLTRNKNTSIYILIYLIYNHHYTINSLTCPKIVPAFFNSFEPFFFSFINMQKPQGNPCGYTTYFSSNPSATASAKFSSTMLAQWSQITAW